MPILSIVRLNIAVSGMYNCLPASLATGGGAGNSGACMLTPRVGHLAITLVPMVSIRVGFYYISGTCRCDTA